MEFGQHPEQKQTRVASRHRIACVENKTGEFSEDDVRREEIVTIVDGVHESETVNILEEGEDMPTNPYYLNGNADREELISIDDMPVKTRPAPKPSRGGVMKTRFHCATCNRTAEVLDYDEESGIIKLDCRPMAHFRPVAVKTVGA
jgi:hypothetical protein